MFKIAFPWARLDEERSERDYLKAHKETSEDEVAGNVWISPGLGEYIIIIYNKVDGVDTNLNSPRTGPRVSNVRLGSRSDRPDRHYTNPVERKEARYSSTQVRASALGYVSHHYHTHAKSAIRFSQQGLSAEIKVRKGTGK